MVATALIVSQRSAARLFALRQAPLPDLAGHRRCDIRVEKWFDSDTSPVQGAPPTIMWGVMKCYITNPSITLQRGGTPNDVWRSS